MKNKRNKEVFIAFRMTEEQVSELDAMLNRGETRSAGIRRILYNAWADMREAQECEGNLSMTIRQLVEKEIA